MKKLISILLMLMVLISGIAMAEETPVEPTATPVVETTADTTADETTEPAAEPTVEASAAPTESTENTEGNEVVEEAEQAIDWSQVSRLNKGLIVTAGGLAGTFLVLILFFLTIKLMQKVLK